MENNLRIKKINAEEEVEFHKKEINITSDSHNDEDELEIL